MLRQAKLLIAFPPYGYSSKGECQFSYVDCWMNPHLNKITCLLNLQRWKVDLNNTAKANFYFGNKTAYVHLIP